MVNDNLSPAAWTCLDCEFMPSASLCRKPDGSHTFERLARAYLIDRELTETQLDTPDVSDADQASLTDQRLRAFDCVGEIVRTTPAAAVGFLVVACAQCQGIAELCVIAAGPLEDLLEAHGAVVIGQLETIAKVDPRFRLMLSGTWGQGRIDPAVWARLVEAVKPGPVIDADPRTPAAGFVDKIATSATLATVFATKRQPPSRGHSGTG